MLAVDPEPQGLLNGGNASSPSGLHLWQKNHQVYSSETFLRCRQLYSFIGKIPVEICTEILFVFIKCKVKWSRYRPGVAQMVGRGIALLFHDRGTRRRWVVSSTPRPHFTPGKEPVPILQEAGWAQGLSGRAENLVPTEIRSRTVQPVVGRYTDWATTPTFIKYIPVFN